MSWEVEYTDEFFAWWGGLTEAEQGSVRSDVKLLMDPRAAIAPPYGRQREGLSALQYERA